MTIKITAMKETTYASLTDVETVVFIMLCYPKFVLKVITVIRSYEQNKKIQLEAPVNFNNQFVSYMYFLF